jgi:hypothetical protein
MTNRRGDCYNCTRLRGIIVPGEDIAATHHYLTTIQPELMFLLESNERLVSRERSYAMIPVSMTEEHALLASGWAYHPEDPLLMTIPVKDFEEGRALALLGA